MRQILLDILGAVLVMVAIVALLSLSERRVVVDPDVYVYRLSAFSLFKSTGLAGLLILFCSALGCVKIARNRAQMSVARLGTPGLLAGVKERMTGGDADGALKFAQADRSYAGRVLAGALARRSAGQEGMQRGLDQAAAAEIARLAGGVTSVLLTGLAALALGFLGTASGLMTSFQIMTLLKSPTPADMSHGVYEALVTIVMGLMAVLVLVPAYFALKRTLSTRTLKINADLGELLSTAGGA